MMFIKNIFKRLVSNQDTNANSSQNQLSPSKTPYDILGEVGVRRIANTFYDIMESDPTASELLQMHPMPLDTIREKFFEFLSGWTGGPALFEQKYGHPRLRARHLPFAVNAQMRDQWLYCMNKTLDIEVQDEGVKAHLKGAFSQMANHMINC